MALDKKAKPTRANLLRRLKRAYEDLDAAAIMAEQRGEDDIHDITTDLRGRLNQLATNWDGYGWRTHGK
jgi:uncharacterized protein YukE